MNNMYGIGYNSSFMSTFFGTGNSNSSGNSSLISSLGDLKMIQNGTYKKALKSYYEAQKSGDSTGTKFDSIKGTGTAEEKMSLSNVKSSAQKLYETSNTLKKADYSANAKPEGLLNQAKDFVNSYNSTLKAAKNVDSYSILQTAIWGTEQMNLSEGILNKVGITIGVDNSLSLDEDTFKKANMSDLKVLFSGNGSLADRVSQKASTLYNQSANQLALNQGQMTYTMYGTLV